MKQKVKPRSHLIIIVIFNCFTCLRSGHIASKCSNRRTIVMKEHKYIEFESDEFKKDEIPPFDNYSDVEYLVDRETLMIRRTPNV